MCDSSMIWCVCVRVETEVKKWSVKCSWDYFMSNQRVPVVKGIISLHTHTYTCPETTTQHTCPLIPPR